ncbi:hypothetical protein DPMN_001048 [Dreissena polymorpha]|uniref:Uncharacterized protein n=1 Tax=Dreissena polymorpha TaxID=45954 RepID=A0A9D4MJH6_DREPO|nr:hypothetical protein DPMN_001048 [Dreissena polymorpha]
MCLVRSGDIQSAMKSRHVLSPVRRYPVAMKSRHVCSPVRRYPVRYEVTPCAPSGQVISSPL